MADVKKMEKLKKIQGMVNNLLLCDDFVITDLETTGLSPAKGGRIIEIGAVRVKNGQITETFSQLINPEVKIYAKTIELTGITNEMLEGKPVYGQVLPEFSKFLGDSIFVAHNAMFDWDRFLIHYLFKVGITPSNEVIDTMVLSKTYFNEKSKHSLAELTNEFGIDIGNHHRALDDSIATAKILLEFKKRFKEDSRFEVSEKSQQVEQVQQDLFTIVTPPAITITEPKKLVFETEIELVGFEEFDNFEKKPEQKVVVNVAVEKPVKVEEANAYKVKRVSYWEKDLTKIKSLKRIYVSLSIGTTYFDIPTKTWYNKDVKDAIDFDALKDSVLGYLKLASVEELCDFRSAK